MRRRCAASPQLMQKFLREGRSEVQRNRAQGSGKSLAESRSGIYSTPLSTRLIRAITLPCAH